MDAREAALRVINEVYNRDAYANIALAREINRQDFSDQDRRFVTELVYGTVKAGETLDWMISRFVSRPLDKMPAVILNILRLGMYQLFFLDKVPASAACNEAVKLAKKYGHQGTVKFVNAILRNAVRNPEKIAYPKREDNAVKYLALKYFHPQWLIGRWLRRLGEEATEALCQINNDTPELSLRTNTLKVTREGLLELLAQEGVTASPSTLVPEGIICHSYPALNSLPSLQKGLFQIQDESSMLVAHVLDPKPGELVIDACGAPGGKSTHIAALMQNKGKVISTDIYDHKLELTKENAERLGINIIDTAVLDARQLDRLYSNQADKVLVDAPCSGLGVLRRKPDSRWRKSEQILQDLPKLQQEILASAAQCVKPDGVLVYSTCTTEEEENQGVIRSFLENCAGKFVLQQTGAYLPHKRNDDLIQLWPHIDHADGFFIARMQRVK